MGAAAGAGDIAIRTKPGRIQKCKNGRARGRHGGAATTAGEKRRAKQNTFRRPRRGVTTHTKHVTNGLQTTATEKACSRPVLGPRLPGPTRHLSVTGPAGSVTSRYATLLNPSTLSRSRTQWPPRLCPLGVGSRRGRVVTTNYEKHASSAYKLSGALGHTDPQLPGIHITYVAVIVNQLR